MSKPLSTYERKMKNQKFRKVYEQHYKSYARFVRAVEGMGHSVIYTDDTGKHFRFYGGTWAWRNHNPGNVYPGSISKKHNRIGIVNKNSLAVFPDYESGHAALIDVLKITYKNYSIDTMMEEFAPRSENPTQKYIKFLYRVTGVTPGKKIKNFTVSEFQKLWKGIEMMEASKEGSIVEVYQISSVRVNHKGIIYSYCISDGWISIEQCIDFARKGLVDLEICISYLGNTNLRAPASSVFQEKLSELIEGKN
jgi:hypothetical protein